MRRTGQWIVEMRRGDIDEAANPWVKSTDPWQEIGKFKHPMGIVAAVRYICRMRVQHKFFDFQLRNRYSDNVIPCQMLCGPHPIFEFVRTGTFITKATLTVAP